MSRSSLTEAKTELARLTDQHALRSKELHDTRSLLARCNTEKAELTEALASEPGGEDTLQYVRLKPQLARLRIALDALSPSSDDIDDAQTLQRATDSIQSSFNAIQSLQEQVDSATKDAAFARGAMLMRNQEAREEATRFQSKIDDLNKVIDYLARQEELKSAAMAFMQQEDFSIGRVTGKVSVGYTTYVVVEYDSILQSGRRLIFEEGAPRGWRRTYPNEFWCKSSYGFSGSLEVVTSYGGTSVFTDTCHEADVGPDLRARILSAARR